MSKYEKYKPSGIDWIGDVPEYWKTLRIKNVATIVNGSTPSSSIEEYWDGDIIWATPGDFNKFEKIIDDSESKITEEGYKSCGTYLVPIGSVVITTRAPIGNVLIAGKELCTNQGCKTLIPNRVESRFLYYIISISSIELNILGQGTTFLELSKESLGTFKLPLPEYSEQLTIANYLDEQTQKIDRLIANKKAQAEKLKELRQIEINNAVTKGLNPKAEMKDSGIEWLGKIPKHWEVKRLKKFTTKIGSGVTPKGGSEVYEERGIPLFRSQNIHFDGLRTDDIVYITQEVHQSMSGSKVEPNDVLLNITGASIGRCYFYDGSLGEANVNQHVCIIRTNSKLDYRYLQQFISSDCAQSQIFMGQTGTSREGLTFQDIKNMFIPTPPPNEQIEITDFVKIRTNKIDLLLKNIEAQLEQLQELRKTKIYEAVTGKIKVSEPLIEMIK